MDYLERNTITSQISLFLNNKHENNGFVEKHNIE